MNTKKDTLSKISSLENTLSFVNVLKWIAIPLSLVGTALLALFAEPIAVGLVVAGGLSVLVSNFIRRKEHKEYREIQSHFEELNEEQRMTLQKMYNKYLAEGPQAEEKEGSEKVTASSTA
ncbi:MAG: hypothetical protein AAF149_05830 [Bacteroidota bacterium]